MQIIERNQHFFTPTIIQMKNQLLLAISLIALLFTACTAEKPADENAETANMPDTTATPAPAEFADAKYSGMVSNMLASFQNEDIPSYMGHFADNAQINWNAGDSITGKAAIQEYWTNRFANVIDSLKFSEHIYLPVKVNQPQANESAGTYVLSWNRTDAKYKTGKSMTQWMHTVYHFDSNDKIDQVLYYMDRAPINAATSK